MMRDWLPLALGIPGGILLALGLAVAAKPGCAIVARPVVGQEPLRYVQVTATIDDRAGGKVGLIDDGGEWTTGIVQPGAWKTLVEWRNLALLAGDYEAVLVTAGGCRAHQRIEVH